MYKRKDIARFAYDYLQPLLADSYERYKKGDLVRMRGNLVEGLLIGVSRGGWIHIYPTFYVIGADPAYEGIHQTVSLEAKNPHGWKFPPETPLDEALAKEILDRLARDSPISFVDPLDDEAIDKGLRWFGRDKLHWSADLFAAFFNMARGASTTRADLARAFEIFRRRSRLSTGKPLRDWEEVLRNRFIELQSRLDRDDCISLCRADAEAHAKVLGLPPIAWPPEWPEQVPPWPNEEPAGWANKLARTFSRKK